MLLSEKIPSEQEFDSTVNSIILRPEYASLRSFFSDLFQTIKDSIRNWILEFLKRSFSNIENESKISDNLSNIFMIIGLLVLVAIVIAIILKTSKAFERKTKVKEILGEKIEEGTSPSSLRAKAIRFEKEGDFRQAIRYDFIAVLLLMHNKSLLYLDETKTNEEILGYLKKNKFTKIMLIKEMVDCFNFSWYGHKSCDKEIYNKWSENLKQLWNEVMHYEG